MNSLNRKSLASYIKGTMLLGLAATTFAQSRPQDTKDIKEIAAFKLTTDGLTKFSKAARALDDMAKKNPSLKERQDLFSDKPDKTIDETVREYERIPGLVSTIKTSGLTPREFVVLSYTLMANSMALANKQAGMKEMPPGASKANMDFIQTHQKEIQALSPDKEKSPPQNKDETQ